MRRGRGPAPGLWREADEGFRRGRRVLVPMHLHDARDRRAHHQCPPDKRKGGYEMVKTVKMTWTPELEREVMKSIDWDKVRSMTEEEIEQAVASDPDASPLTETE